MLIVSDALKQAFMEPERTIYVRIKIGNRTFDNDDVVSIEYDSGSLSGEVFAIGSTYSNSIKVTFSELVEGLKELDEVIYEIGIKLPDGTNGYVPMGTFIINEAIEMDRNNNKTIIECMDRMVMMGGAYMSSLTYPAPIREVALEIANKAGVTVDVTSFERLSADRIAKPEGYTYREAIGLIAQFEAGFATFNRFGKLEIRTLSDPMFTVPPDNYFSKGLVKNEVFFRLGGISCTTDDGDTVIQSGNSAGNQVVLENRVMTKALLDKIYQKIQTINYYPFSLSWQGNPVLEAGDWIEVEDLQGNKFKTPNLNYSLSFSGGLSAKSSADTTTQSDVTYQYKSPLQQKLEWIQARIDAAGGNVVYEGIDEPANPKEGDLWFKIIGPDKEILVYQKDKDGNLFWDPQISTADINKVAKEMEKIIAQADADRKAAEQNFEQAIVDAAAYTNIKAQEFDNQLLIVNQDLVIAKKSADSALTKADQAIQDVGFMQIDVTTAKTNATTALENANTAKSNAGSALTNANSALTKVGALEVTTGSLQTSYNELTKTVGLKADKTTVDGINSKVTQHGLDISANATAVELKADKSVVDSIKGTVDKHTLDIKAAADGLTLKADSNLVNTIKGTVDTHTTQISANSTAINARLTSAQVETLLTGKKYVNETTLNATANGLSASITQVSSDLSNLEIEGRNYFNPTATPIYKIGGGTFTVNENVPYGFYAVGDQNNTLVARLNNVITGNGDWTISFDLKGSQNGGGAVTVDVNNMGDTKFTTSVDNEYTRRSFTVKVTNYGDGSTYHFVDFKPSWAYIWVKNIKVEKGNRATGWTPAPEDMATLEKVTSIEANVDGLQTTVASKADKSQITQLSSQISTKVESSTYTSKMTQLDSSINLRVQKGDVVSQFNIDAGRTLISTGKLLLDANTYIMGTTFANDIKAKSLEAVYADIATLKTKVLTADVITSTMVKSDTALVDKIFATDANVNRLTAKTAFINSVKAIDIAADRITTGTLNAANVNIINLNASKIVASNLSALTTNTGALNVTDWLTFSTDNKGIRANYDFGDQLGGSFDPRWFVGNYTLGYRYMKFLADVYTVSASGGRGNYGYYSETFYGPDYFKLRQYNNSTMTRLLTRIDMRSEYISLSTSFDETKIYLNANGDTFFAGNMQVNGDLWVGNLKALKAYYVQAPETANNLYINGGRNDLGSMRFGLDGSTLNGGRLISSDSIYHRTYSSASNVIVWDTGTIGRSVSARKYKLNIESNDLLETALKTLSISPSSWHDKAEVESIAKTMSNGTEQELDPNFRLKRHYGFIADEFHEKGATEVVMYDSKGEVEGLAYDRISMYHHELIKDLYHKIEQQENKIKELERKTA